MIELPPSVVGDTAPQSGYSSLIMRSVSPHRRLLGMAAPNRDLSQGSDSQKGRSAPGTALPRDRHACFGRLRAEVDAIGPPIVYV